MAPRETSRPPNRHRERHGESSRRDKHRRRRSESRRPRPAVESSDETRESRRTRALSAGALAQLEQQNARSKRNSERRPPRTEKTRPERPKRVRRDDYEPVDRSPGKSRRRDESNSPKKSGKGRRAVSGALMEEGRTRSGLRGGKWSEESVEKEDRYHRPRAKKSTIKKKWWIIGGISLVVVIVIIVVAVVVSQKNKKGGSSGSSSLDGQDHSSIPKKWQNTYLDPWTWKTTQDFNTTFTDQMVGGLPVMGLLSKWDDSTRANGDVPPLNKPWGSYGKTPARGVNLGGWLSLEPFIAPSLFDYPEDQGVIDEWTLCRKLGSSAGSTLEEHYANFVTEDTFKDIQAAGLDHIRIPYSYWAVETYDDDPYVFRTSWRYLLRAIEWARKYGLRVNLDLHGLPGSQNGWNHSGRWGEVRWFNGTDGDKNAQRSLDIHNRLSQFFAQDRYKNIITHYGLANEPRMTFLDSDKVMSWTESAYGMVRKNGLNALVIFGDGFMGLPNWKGKMQGYDGLVLDVHQYVIFNKDQIDYTHQKKVQYACKDWTQQTEESMDTSTGFGPTQFAEWSQADTDCAKFLTNVGWGNRWEGTYADHGDNSSSVLSPDCPLKNSECSCDKANADPSTFTDDYKKFLSMFAEAQMHSFEKGWGWWYWTWKTESAYLWSYESGLKAGILPKQANKRDFNCDSDVPDFSGLSEAY